MFAVSHTDTAPVLMVGHPSSGTSITGQLIRDYLGIAFGTESQFIPFYFKRLKRYGDLDKDGNLMRLIRDLLQERWFQRSRKFGGFQTDEEMIFSNVRNRTYRGLLDAIFGVFAEHCEMTRWGDKLSAFPDELQILAELFPDAKYIYMMRDGRDVALSVMGRYFGAKNIFTAAHEWRHCVRATDDFVRRFPSSQVHQMRYEDLLTDPVAEFQRLIAFLQIDDENGTLLSRIEREVPGKLNRSNFYKWRNRWTENQRRSFERIGCVELKQHGYDTIVEEPIAEPGLLTRIFWHGHHKVRIWSYPSYWRNNLYRLKVRSRDVWRAFRSKVVGAT